MSSTSISRPAICWIPRSRVWASSLMISLKSCRGDLDSLSRGSASSLGVPIASSGATAIGTESCSGPRLMAGKSEAVRITRRANGYLTDSLSTGSLAKPSRQPHYNSGQSIVGEANKVPPSKCPPRAIVERNLKAARLFRALARLSNREQGFVPPDGVRCRAGNENPQGRS